MPVTRYGGTGDPDLVGGEGALARMMNGQATWSDYLQILMMAAPGLGAAGRFRAIRGAMTPGSIAPAWKAVEKELGAPLAQVSQGQAFGGPDSFVPGVASMRGRALSTGLASDTQPYWPGRVLPIASPKPRRIDVDRILGGQPKTPAEQFTSQLLDWFQSSSAQ